MDIVTLKVQSTAHQTVHSIVNSQNSLFNLGMFTYSYERPNIIQIAPKRPGE
jgi:hypothetical protein